MQTISQTANSADLPAWQEPVPTAALVLADGKVLYGKACGATGEAAGELCFNTSMTGYQEILTDPSYSGQIITFTFPHIGNVGSNDEDIESLNLASVNGARGCVMRAEITDPANYRAGQHFDHWLKARGIVGICGIDTRALTTKIREGGLINGLIVHNSTGEFDESAMKSMAAALPSMEGVDLAKDVTTLQMVRWDETPWTWEKGFGQQINPDLHVVAVDYGVKRNILRLLAGLGCRVTVVPGTATAEIILGHQPDGIFLSNGPGDPAATAHYAVPVIQELIASGLPIFGICLGHQMLALALGAKTSKMHQGHHGANHPVLDHTTDKVEITSMNHGFAVDGATLPEGVEPTHTSLFDGSNSGIQVTGRPIFSVQHHPEASPGPQDSHYLFKRFVELMKAA
uniref:glutamine-hydrolyzing carbamoyl-phosphate synthase small subunit n=1 Tax=Pararhizobium sp. IMCC3301 TaxID=3067904 RepID=UPI0027419F83|nr:glutamine-hydrolyzing carbamoyl-phosphate synthase small subunit [Pararhizobium sp. IMCC3301]